MKMFQKSRINHVTEASDVVSDKYRFVSSDSIIKKITGTGLIHLGTSWAKLRTDPSKRKGQQKHVMAFGKESGEGLRILVTNDHEGRNALKFDIGYFRAACANGIIVGKSVWSYKHSHRRMLYVSRIVEEALYHAAGMEQGIDLMREHECTSGDQAVLLKALSTLRKHDIRATSIVPQRRADHSQDLWTQYNMYQEYAMRGGYDHFILDKAGNRKTEGGEFKTRQAQVLNGFQPQFTVNAGLWERVRALV